MRFNAKGYVIALVCVALVIVATVVTVLVAGNGNVAEPTPAPSYNPADNTAKVEDIKVEFDKDGKPEVSIPEGYKAADKLYTKVLKEGDGEEIKASDSVTADYSGWLTDGTKFDSSYDRGKPETFSLEQVIKGWTEALTGKKVGSTVFIVVPSDLGYGSKASGPIPANATLVFVVHVDSVKEK
ncbi:MAG: FKBP-type peptidyl-prolyl cis-trans isomerase [Bifidobacteriaceae bacterium]|jgi:peptidylprolyl isomerase|nr:FKBP-type peptidyl-prolyl cis-trans isomerase [Bifidobacteriaceae bacterium]